MGILAWIIIGGLAGWIASMIIGNNAEQGVVGNIVVGIIGALLGGFLSGLILNRDTLTGFNFTTLIVAILGATIFLWVLRKVTHKV
ncbi:MAG: Transglycosylase-associated protein [Candidatus Saccharibacteria bacterium]|nr:Transglycosylase-associated protein [Candidatus Saccharibacteria bacterium]